MELLSSGASLWKVHPGVERIYDKDTSSSDALRVCGFQGLQSYVYQLPANGSQACRSLNGLSVPRP